MDKLKNFLVINKKKLISAIIVLFFIIILAVSIYYMTIDDGLYKSDDWSSTPFAVSTYTQGAKIGENGIEFDTTPQELWNKMMQNGSNVGRYLSSPEELEKLMQAEVVTQFPKVGVTDPDKLDGIVEFKREDSNSNVTNLKYVKESTFDSYIENYKNSGDTTALNYFSMDDKGNVLMAQWTETTTTTTTKDEDGNVLSKDTTVVYSMIKTPINYKSVVLKYSMPFDYLWALLVVSDSKSFVLELADYILKDTQIEITGQEKLNESIDTQEEQNQVQVQVEVTDPDTGEKSIETKTQTQTTEVKTEIKSTTITPEVTKADTWIYSSTDTNESGLNPKLDPKSEERNFITIFNSHSGARRNIPRYADWLFEILESNDSTANMVDLTKYWLYVATGKNYGFKEYDFGEYEKNNFSTLGMSTSSNVLFDYLASWENQAVWQYLRGEVGYSSYLSKYITQDKSEYICYVDSNTSTRNFGFGVCHTGDNGRTYWHIGEYQEEGIAINSGQYDTIGVSKLSVNIVDSVKEKLLAGYQQSVKTQVERAGITDLTQAQIDSLTCIMYQYGNIGNFVDVYKRYGNTDALISAAKSRSGKTYFNSNVESNGRSQANWKLFHEGKYISGAGTELDANSYGGNGQLLDVATKIWQEVCTSGKYTSYGGAGSIPARGPSIDCSAYVSWVLYELGYKEEFYYQHSAQMFYSTNWNQKYGWQEIPVGSGQNPYDILQPGDIFVRYGSGTHHVNIVVELKEGKLYAYDCGSLSNWIGNTSATPIDRSYFLTKQGAGKIIRISQ